MAAKTGMPWPNIYHRCCASGRRRSTDGAVLVTVFVPAALRQFAADQGRVVLELSAEQPATVDGVLRCLHARHPGVVERALDETWAPRPHVNIFVDGQSIRSRACRGLDTPVHAGAEVWILPAVSGG
jgi:molybdopterin converting factor small subunit